MRHENRTAIDITLKTDAFESEFVGRCTHTFRCGFHSDIGENILVAALVFHIKYLRLVHRILRSVGIVPFDIRYGFIRNVGYFRFNLAGILEHDCVLRTGRQHEKHERKKQG